MQLSEHPPSHHDPAAFPSSLATLHGAIERQPVVVSPDISVAQAVEIMGPQSSCVLVESNHQLLGIITERDIVRLTAKGINFQETPVDDVMSRHLITLQLKDFQRPFAAWELLQRHQIRHLPILDQQGRLMGLLTPKALRQTLRSSDLFRLRRVVNVMGTKVITAAPSSKMMAVAQLMANHRVSCVVIVEAQASGNGTNHPKQVPLGIVTERDIVKFKSQQLDLFNITAGQVMSQPLCSVSPEDTLWAAHQTMQRLRVRRLVVLQAGKLSGIITQSNILSALNPVELYDTIQVLQQELDQLRDERLASAEARSSDLTEQVQEAESRFQAVFHNMFQFIGLISPDGTVLDVNQTALAVGGLSLEEVVGRPAWETYWWTISPETQSQFREAITRAAQGEFVRYEVDLLGIGEAPLCIDFSLRPLKDAQGNVTLLIGEGRDITELKQVQQNLTFQIEFDRLIAGLSNRFINLSTDKIPAAINQALQALGEFAGVDICYIMKYSENMERAWMTYEWVAPGIPPHKEQIQDLPCSTFPWTCQLLAKGKTLYIQDVETSPPQAAIDQKLWQQFGLSSILKIPLGVEGQIFGSVAVGTFHRSMDWSEHNIQMLQLFAEILSNAIQRQQDELELRASEQRFQSLAEIAPVGISRTDVDGNCLYFNQRWTEITGLSCSESEGDGWLQGVHPEDREAVMSAWHQAVQEHQPFYLEYRYLRPDESIAWVIEQCVIEHDAQGQVAGYVGTLTDITERVQARQELQDSEERLRLALASGKQGFYDHNVQTGCCTVNEDYVLMLGYEPETFQESDDLWAERLHPEDRERAIQNYRAYVRGDIPEYSIEFRQRMPNGDWKWILSLGKIVDWDEAGRPLRMLGTHTDIDAIKQAEQLKSELRVLEDILEATLAGYWDWDLLNNREYLSPTFKQMLGYEEHELANEPESWQQLIFKDDLPEVEASLEQHIQSKGAVPFCNEVRYRHKNGSVIWVICAGRVIDWDESGTPLRLVGCHVDITQRKQAEEQLQALNQDLKRSNKDLEQFAYITSHDLQEPLRAVTAYTNLLLENYGDVLTDANAKKYTGYILDGTQQMRALIRDLLAYSRVGSSTLKLTSVNCNELLAAVQLNLQEAIAHSQAQITIGPLPVIEGDRTQLLQLFQNLLSNAIKFNPGDKPPQIQLSAIRQAALQADQQPANRLLRQQGHWLFSVQDQGIGIREKYQERIFDIFRRLHTREQFSGTGMGLSICQRVIERHGGEIWVESQVGTGSTFYFTFPIQQQLSQEIR